jgi:hypothetical protein
LLGTVTVRRHFSQVSPEEHRKHRQRKNHNRPSADQDTPRSFIAASSRFAHDVEGCRRLS